MDDSVVYAVRAKFAEDLEELVQCPVCFERPSGRVSMCDQGHHLCLRCRQSLLQCPTCRSKFSLNARNFAVEGLCSKIDDIVSALLEPQLNNSLALPLHVTTAAAKKSNNKRTTATQTDAQDSRANESVVFVADDDDDDDDHEKLNLSFCHIGSCKLQLPADKIYRHVRDCHDDNLIEVGLCNGHIYRSWELGYDVDRSFHYALHCATANVLVFVNVFIDEEGNLLAGLKATCPKNRPLKYVVRVDAPGSPKSEFKGELTDGWKTHVFQASLFEGSFLDADDTLDQSDYGSFEFKLDIDCGYTSNASSLYSELPSWAK